MDQLELQVVDVIAETKDSSTILLASLPGSDFNYEAGQFLTFIFARNGREIRRSYSFSSTPGIDPLASITVKRKPNGEISRFLLDQVGRGSLLHCLAAAGRFTLDLDLGRAGQVFFIAGGSGISPIFSLLKKVLYKDPRLRVVLIDQNHDESSIIFGDQLRQFQDSYPQRFQWVNLLSKPQDKHRPSQRLTNALLEELVNAMRVPHTAMLFYLCGPPAFMRMAQFTLRLMGFTDDQIRKENFTVDFIPRPPLLPDKSGKNIRIHYQEQTFDLVATYPQSILDAALQRKLPLPYSCRAGRCASCVARCVRGKVVMSNNEVLTEGDLLAGLVLTCVGYAQTDLEILF
jgi:ring-1,2-phenylacetyl-CoA epoxidase subunit PaaE